MSAFSKPLFIFHKKPFQRPDLDFWFGAFAPISESPEPYMVSYLDLCICLVLKLSGILISSLLVGQMQSGRVSSKVLWGFLFER